MVAVAFFNMASALLILVLERTRMIGLLKAMRDGRTAASRRIFLYRAAFIVGRGLLWGNLAAGLLCLAPSAFRTCSGSTPAGYMLSEVPVAVSAGWWLAARRRGGGSDSSRCCSSPLRSWPVSAPTKRSKPNNDYETVRYRTE